MILALVVVIRQLQKLASMYQLCEEGINQPPSDPDHNPGFTVRFWNGMLQVDDHRGRYWVVFEMTRREGWC